MLKLLLLRHGKATKFIDDKSDFTRRLNRQGVAQINQIGYILKEKQLEIDQIISSGATRTKETSEIINHYLNVGTVEFDENLYLAKYNSILTKICNSGKGKNLLFVGHNNGISDLATYLTNQRLILSTGHLVEIQFNIENWSMVTKASGKFEIEIIPNIYTV